jgi:hypothetical protein
MGFNELCPGVLQNYVRTPNVLSFSQVIKTIFLEVGVNIFDFPQLAKSISGLVIIKIVKDEKKNQ